MNRQQRRSKGIKEKAKTYVLTSDQIDNLRNDIAAEILSRLFVMSCIALKRSGSTSQQVEEHADLIAELYDLWATDSLDMGSLENELWDYAGIKFAKG